MKFIPDGLGRRIGESSLLASEHAPKVLFVGGVVGMVTSTVLACRATLNVEKVLDAIEEDEQVCHINKAKVAAGEVPEGTTYSDKEYRDDLRLIKIRGAVTLVKLYAPAVLVGGLSIAALTKSYNILQDRTTALTAAYAAVDGAYRRYRERVVDRYGEDVDRELRYESERVDIVDEETGKVVSTTQVTDAPGSEYARFYDELSSKNWSVNPDINMLFLRNVQNYCNDRLRIRGHLFLNEVFTELGMTHTKAGAIVGWRWNRNSGDDFVDFGIWDKNSDVIDDFFNGREGAILLDFNVDGVIWDKIEESGI